MQSRCFQADGDGRGALAGGRIASAILPIRPTIIIATPTISALWRSASTRRSIGRGSASGSRLLLHRHGDALLRVKGILNVADAGKRRWRCMRCSISCIRRGIWARGPMGIGALAWFSSPAGLDPVVIERSFRAFSGVSANRQWLARNEAITTVDVFLTNCRLADSRLVDIGIADGRSRLSAKGAAPQSSSRGG